MNWCRLLLLSVWPLAAGGELVWLPDAEPQQVFARDAQAVKAVIRNRGAQRVTEPIYARLYQVSSATMAPLGKPWFWRRLEMLPGQTVLEEIRVSFPQVRAAAPFRLFWLNEHGTTLAYTEVWAYPTDLLQSLKTLADGAPLGVFDPAGRLKPLLHEQQIEFDDLARSDTLAGFKGRLVIVGPVEQAAQIPETFAQQLGRRAKDRGLAIVWFQSPDEHRFRKPSVAHRVPLGNGAMVVSPASLVADLTVSPRSQINLVSLAELAVQPAQLPFPIHD